MKLIVGLGNPGDEYISTRHNVGFMLVDRMAKSSWKQSKSGLLTYSWLGSEVELIKPQTFMNKSGEAVGLAVKKHNIDLDDVCIVHDDLDIQFGEYKFQKGKGPKVHKGVLSVERVLEGEDFWRMRIGTDNRQGEMKQIPGEKYVLSKFSEEEIKEFEDIFISIVSKMEEWSV